VLLLFLVIYFITKMTSKYFNSLPNFNSKNINVDRENGILKNTCIAQYGENKNDSFFDEIFLSELAKQGNKADGIKSRFGHPNACSTSFGSFIGRYKNFNIQNKNLYADLYLDPITKKTQVEGKGISMFDYITEMAESNPDMFGNSIHIFSELIEEDINGKTQTLHKLVKFNACDLVDDPAATDTLFSSNPQDLGEIITSFLDKNPQIFQTISKQPAIIQDFFERYANYSNRKSLINFNMSFFDKIKKTLAGKRNGAFDIDITLADGTIATVITDAEKPQVGDKVVDDTGAPLKDDQYVLPDGGAMTIVGGAIDELTASIETDEPTTGDPAPSQSLQEVMHSVSSLAKAIESLKSTFEKSQNETQSVIELLAGKFSTIENKVNILGKNVTSSYNVPTAEPTNNKTQKFTAYDPELAQLKREEIKNAKTK
jgi:hypothetical protein